MFSVGEKANYTRFVWATEEDEIEKVNVIKIISEDSVYIENAKGTLKRVVNISDLTKLAPRPSPFGNII